MKNKNKSKVLPWLVLLSLMLTTVISSGWAQPHNPHPYRHNNYHHHPAYQSVLGDRRKHNSPYQFVRSLPYSGGAHLIGGGRIVEAFKAHSLHDSSSSHHHHRTALPQFLRTAASQPSSAYYPGYYGGHRYNTYPSYPLKDRQTPYSLSSSMYTEPHYGISSPTTVTTTTTSSPSVFHSVGHLSSPPSRFPPNANTYPSTDTYNEALDLFSEVVRKLEKETGPGFGAISSPNHLQSSLLPNGIFGSASPTSGLPQHIDSVMGPDFLQRAHKLYNKIISEQNYKRGPPPIGHYSSASRSHPLNGLSYLENVYRPEGSRSNFRSTSPNYSQSSPNSRNIIVDETAPDSALEKSLIDTVNALKINLGKNNGDREHVDSETSESRMVPQVQYPSSSNRNYDFVGSTSAFRDLSPSQSDSFQELLSSTINPSTAPQISPVSGHTIPLNENDFIEHPLSYKEYEELIKEIAANHNY